jgi:hypothetical protein
MPPLVSCLLCPPSAAALDWMAVTLAILGAILDRRRVGSTGEADDARGGSDGTEADGRRCTRRPPCAPSWSRSGRVRPVPMPRGMRGQPGGVLFVAGAGKGSGPDVPRLGRSRRQCRAIARNSHCPGHRGTGGAFLERLSLRAGARTVGSSPETGSRGYPFKSETIRKERLPNWPALISWSSDNGIQRCGCSSDGSSVAVSSMSRLRIGCSLALWQLYDPHLGLNQVLRRRPVITRRHPPCLPLPLGPRKPVSRVGHPRGRIANAPRSDPRWDRGDGPELLGSVSQ